jgi:hypothetical protein
MLNLTKKDCVIIGLFFTLLLVITPLLGLVDETPLESSMPPAMGLLSVIGFLIVIPIMFVASIFGFSGRSSLNMASWLSAIVYSIILAFILSKLNSKRVKK